MGKKKRGYQQCIGVEHNSSKAVKAILNRSDTGLDSIILTLDEFDLGYLKMIKDTASESEESASVVKIVDSLMETKSLVGLRDEVANLSHKSQGGSLYSQKSVAEFACFIFLGSQFSMVKKYVQAVILNVDEKTVLNTLENIIIEFACCDDFERRMGNLTQISDLMRAFEYKLMAYFEIYHRLIEQNPLEDDKKYEVQEDFLKIVQMKISQILKYQTSTYLAKNEYIMNHYTTKSLVEFLHAYLNFLNRFNSKIQLDANKECIEFVGDQLSNHLTQRDIITQCSIIYWMLIKIKYAETENFDLLMLSLKSKTPSDVLTKKKEEIVSEKYITKSITSMAKIRGYVVNLDKNTDLNQILSREVKDFEENSESENLADFILANCEKNEGLQKLYSFHTLEAVLTRMKSIDSISWLQRVSRLLFKNFEYPLHSVQSLCEGIMKKLLFLCNKEQIQEIMKIVALQNSIHEFKSKFLTLNMMLDHIDALQYIKENPNAISEMINFSKETLVMGKYVLAFFESILRKLWTSFEGKQDQWFDTWINEYLSALRSGDDSLRSAVCSNITPIVIKINKISLPYILSRFLQEYQKIEGKNIGTLSSLMTLLKVARINKMIVIHEKDIRLDTETQNALSELQPEGTPDFSILQSDLLKLVLTQNWKMSLECFMIVTQETKSEASVSKFELDMCLTFLKSCVRTTFPEHRQNFMKAIKTFMMRVRTAYSKDIKKYVSGEEKTQELSELCEFLKDAITYCEQSLYVDKPIETALPLFEILRMIQDQFGDYDYVLKMTQVFPALCLLSKEDLMQSKPFVMFLLNNLKSSWVLVRNYSFSLVTHLPKEHLLLNDKKFVNELIYGTAMNFCNNPKAMIAEGSGLLLKLLFTKCLNVLDFIKPAESIRDMQLQFCRHVLSIIKERLAIFHTTLIKEGKTNALLHGLLSFFKNLFEDFKITRVDLSPEQFNDWRLFFNDLMTLCLEISRVCAGLLSNNRLQETEGEGNSVDCRGHPMIDAPDNGEANGDYSNLILVGVWLAVKENGQTLNNMMKWFEIPNDEVDDTKFLQDKDIKGLCDSLLTMLFDFKHRGAIEKAAENFSLLCNKLLCSTQQKYQKLPQQLLEQTFKRITSEDHSTILRRSAGMPPTIIAILRSEPLSNQPILLNTTLDFMLKLAQSNSDSDDSKIHALNIMRFIFQDALLKHDIGKYITPAMILATENFKSDNWSIRNSALMCFTSLTKRLLNTTNVQDQDLSRKKGLSIWEFVSKFSELSDYFKKKLNECLAQKNADKQGRERSDMVIFSILLFISRLIPAFHLTDSTNLTTDEDEQIDEKKTQLQKSREDSMQEYIGLIKAYAKNGTYFVRKISAQALLPIVNFENYVSEISHCFDELECRIEGKSSLKQNEAHGLMVRINIFLRAYYQYRDFNQTISGRSSEEEAIHRPKQENQMIEQFMKFEKYHEKSKETFSQVTTALFIKSFRQIIKRSTIFEEKSIAEIKSLYSKRLSEMLELKIQNPLIKPDEQVYLKDLTKMNMILQTKSKDASEITSQLQIVLSNPAFLSMNIDYAVKFMKYFHSKVKQLVNFDQTKDLYNFLTNNTLSMLIKLKDENYCKLLEFTLKLIFRIKKHSNHQENRKELKNTLKEMVTIFDKNSNLLSMYIKLIAQMTDCNSQEEINEIGQIFKKNAYADQLEQVRVANVKSLTKILKKVDLSKNCCVDIFMSILFILNDEHPEIRAYFVQSVGAKKLVVQSKYSLESQSLTSEPMLIDLNEQVLTESVLETALAFDKKAIVNQLLVQKLILGNPYREHNLKNFDEKIFFFEPINKYYDLLWLKRIAFQLLLANKEHIDLSLLSAASNPSGSSDDLEMSETCLMLEDKVQTYMVDLLMGKDSLILTTSSRSFVNSLILN